MARYGGKGVSRRVVLKGAAALGGSAVGSSIGGFPTVWAQNIKGAALSPILRPFRRPVPSRSPRCREHCAVGSTVL
jgi:hypothetical protein